MEDADITLNELLSRMLSKFGEWIKLSYAASKQSFSALYKYIHTHTQTHTVHTHCTQKMKTTQEIFSVVPTLTLTQPTLKCFYSRPSGTKSPTLSWNSCKDCIRYSVFVCVCVCVCVWRVASKRWVSSTCIVPFITSVGVYRLLSKSCVHFLYLAVTFLQIETR